MKRIILALILLCASASAGWAFYSGFIGAVGSGGLPLPPVNLVSYIRSDYSANNDITITGGDAFNVTCTGGNYPRAEDDPAAGINTSVVTYGWSLQITAYSEACPFISIGGTILANGEYCAVGTYTGTITTGTTGYIRIGANCSSTSDYTNYKLVLTPQ